MLQVMLTMFDEDSNGVAPSSVALQRMQEVQQKAVAIYVWCSNVAKTNTLFKEARLRANQWYIVVFQHLPDQEFYRHMRMTRNTFNQLCRLVQRYMRDPNATGFQYPIDMVVGVCVWRLGTTF